MVYQYSPFRAVVDGQVRAMQTLQLAYVQGDRKHQDGRKHDVLRVSVMQCQEHETMRLLMYSIPFHSFGLSHITNNHQHNYGLHRSTTT